MTRDMAVKRLRKEDTITMVDILSRMPESLQLRILSSLDVRYAVGTSMLSKSWLSLWTCLPVLNFSSHSFENLHVFDNFVVNVLSRRQSVKLNKLTFRHGGTYNIDKILEKVFDYAFSHGVEELEANVYRMERWPIGSHVSSDSLTSLKLEGLFTIADCWFLEPRSGSFKNLTNLHLKLVNIVDLDPFSGFPVLDKLTLVCCQLETKGHALNVHAPQLSEFSILQYRHHVKFCEFTTPKLRYFEWRGLNFPRLKTNLPVLDTAVIDYHGYCLQNLDKMMFDDLLMLFDVLRNAKTLTVYLSIVRLLTLFPNELANRSSPFWDLKCLKLDFTSSLRRQNSREGPCKVLMNSLQLVSVVKAYLLHKSHDAKCVIISNVWPFASKATQHTF